MSNLKEEIKNLTERLTAIESQRRNPIPDVLENAATTEAIFSILRKRCGVTEDEMTRAANLYGSAISAFRHTV